MLIPSIHMHAREYRKKIMTSHGRHCEQEEILSEDLEKASSSEIAVYL